MTQLFIVTTSHSQYDQVESLSKSFSSFLLSQNLKGNDILATLIVVESGICISNYSKLKILDNLKILPVQARSSSFWSQSVQLGFKTLLDLKEYNDASRVVLMNCDMSPSSWEFILSPASSLETVPLRDNRQYLLRSGFTPRFLGLYNDYKARETDGKLTFECVPTRLISLEPQIAVSTFYYRLKQISSLLPHYAADYAITSYVSACMGCNWVLRSDSFITEDKSTSGIKKLARLSINSFLKALTSIKSTYNIRSNLFFPWVYHLQYGSKLLFVTAFYCRYIIRLLMGFFFGISS